MSVPDAKSRASSSQSAKSGSERYRRLPTGAHGIDPEEVKRDQRERLQSAIVELIAERGYQAVRILDLTKLARVSRPTFYSLYDDKEELFLAAYNEIAQRTAQTVLAAYETKDSRDLPNGRLQAAIRAFTEMAATAPEAASLMVLGAFGAGPKAIERHNRTFQALEESIRVSRDAPSGGRAGGRGSRKGRPGASEKEVGEDLTIKIVLGGMREVTASRLRQGRVEELPAIADELAAWAACYPAKLPTGLRVPPRRPHSPGGSNETAATAGDPRSERALRAEGRLPSGRHDLPRHFIIKNQRERIVDATAAIVAEKGLANLTIPEIARRANVSHQTFYEMYPTKHDAFLGTQKVGLHQALGVTVTAIEEHKDDWPRGIAAGIRALLGYLASEPAHAHLILVDTFAASPEAIEIRDTSIHAFAAYLQPGYHYASQNGSGTPADKRAPVGRAPGVTPEAIAGGIWQVLNYYVELERIDELPAVAPQLVYAALTPFIGPKEAAKTARRAPARR
ncbi:MAG TPA: TetR/AcrR family transcriptional regulator [Solirubrobacteraceae bacterium]